MNNTQKVALVTGSRRGIGYSIAHTIAKNDYLLILSDIIGEDEAAPILSEFRSHGYEADYIPCDISKESDRTGIFDTIRKKYGRLDVLVNNAGVAPLTRLDILETTEKSFDFLMDINLKGTFFMCQAAANAMIGMKAEIEDYHPRIVNISSMSAYTSSTNRGEYCISKAGISMITKLFADRMAEYSIPVFEVRPGIIMTDMTASVTEKYQKLINEGVTPIRRFGQPQDVADCVMAAVSGLLDFATGQVLNADGGFHIRRL
ncbi:MAG: 3-ketoacyl-ACP reductase [Oscillospiraceae bacterium]|nr:3-ketoacyl-ACP reductase [Oscillospiraceae bacterium]